VINQIGSTIQDYYTFSICCWTLQEHGSRLNVLSWSVLRLAVYLDDNIFFLQLLWGHVERNVDTFSRLSILNRTLGIINANIFTVESSEEFTEQWWINLREVFVDWEGELSGISDTKWSRFNIKIDFAVLLWCLDLSCPISTVINTLSRTHDLIGSVIF
jgi:hypothetical protein